MGLLLTTGNRQSILIIPEGGGGKPKAKPEILKLKAKTMKTEKHYEALTRIAKSNFEAYTEMVDQYETADDCRDSFCGNTGDTVRENVKGWDQEDVDYAVGTYINLIREYREKLADFVAIKSDGEIVDNSGLTWDQQVKWYDAVAGVALTAEFDGFGYVGEEFYGDESLIDTIKNSELFLKLKCCIEENEIDRLNKLNGVDSSGYAQ